MDNLEKYAGVIVNLEPKLVKNLDPNIVDVIIGSEDELKKIREQFPLNSKINSNSKRNDAIMTSIYTEVVFRDK